MKSRKPNTSDVAQLAGVSRITVDRVLNGRGGVRPETEHNVISAARSLGLDRALTVMPTRILRIGVILQNNKNSYYIKLRECFHRVAQQYKRYNFRVSFFYFEDLSANAAQKTLRKASSECDALIVVLFHHPDVVNEVKAIATRMPVVTLASDLPNSGRVDYVGANAIQEGRTAGALMGRFLGAEGGEILIIMGLHQLLEHEQREVGFRSALRRSFPACTVVECVESFERQDIGQAVRRMLDKFPRLRGIYNMSIGDRSLAEVLRSVGKEHDIFLVTHTVTREKVILMTEGVIDAVVDRDSDLDARRAVEILLHASGRFSEAEITMPQRPQIFLRENVLLE